jgi:hypothetical protein
MASSAGYIEAADAIGDCKNRDVCDAAMLSAARRWNITK